MKEVNENLPRRMTRKPTTTDKDASAPYVTSLFVIIVGS